MSLIDLIMNKFDLIQEEIGFIRTRHTSKPLAFALLFKYYQKNPQFINELTLPAYIINQVANQFNIPSIICEVLSRAYEIKNKLTKEDKRALTPLIYEHINSYGLFSLDLSTRLPHLHYGVRA